MPAPQKSGATLNQTLGASAAITGLLIGVPYLIIADVDCWLNDAADAAVGAGVYIPAKVPVILAFDAVPEGYSAGACHASFTPLHDLP